MATSFSWAFRTTPPTHGARDADPRSTAWSKQIGHTCAHPNARLARAIIGKYLAQQLFRRNTVPRQAWITVFMEAGRAMVNGVPTCWAGADVGTGQMNWQTTDATVCRGDGPSEGQ